MGSKGVILELKDNNGLIGNSKIMVKSSFVGERGMDYLWIKVKG